MQVANLLRDRNARASPTISACANALFVATHRTIVAPHTRAAILSPSDPRGVFWMWHPDNHQDVFEGRVVYLGYPAGQDAVDAVAARHGLLAPIISDPSESAPDRRISPEDACARFECRHGFQ
jgi:hypothetical protein